MTRWHGPLTEPAAYHVDHAVVAAAYQIGMSQVEWLTIRQAISAHVLARMVLGGTRPDRSVLGEAETIVGLDRAITAARGWR